MQHKLSTSTIEKLEYYVYLLIDPKNNKPFYAGKGKGNRINQHLLGALKDIKKTSDKFKTIRDIEKKNLKIKNIILRYGLSEKEAFEVESAVIDLLEKDNLTNIVKGYHADDRGIIDLEDIKIKYEAEPAVFKEPALLINIKKKFRKGMSQKEIYEATRKHWRVNVKKAEKIRSCLLCIQRNHQRSFLSKEMASFK